MDQYLELFDTIFNTKYYDDAEYSNDGKVTYINNIREISNEFYTMKNFISDFTILGYDEDMLFNNVMISYEYQPFASAENRIKYIIAQSYCEQYEKKLIDKKNYENNLENIVKKRWENYKKYATEILNNPELISRYSYLGIVEKVGMEMVKIKKKGN